MNKENLKTHPEYVKYNEELLAIILRSSFSKEGASFFTTQEDPFQFGALNYKKGTHIKAHRHIRAKREIDLVSEVLFIQKGRVEVLFYNNDKIKIDSKVLETGDIILLKKMGHGFNLLEDSKIVEVKQGPYLGKENDKEYLDI